MPTRKTAQKLDYITASADGALEARQVAKPYLYCVA